MTRRLSNFGGQGFTDETVYNVGQTTPTPPSTSGSVRVRGGLRVLSISELHRVGSSLQPTGVEFKFGRENFSAPRGAQSFGVQLRTVRNDLPGAEEPTEQVLGWNYTPFTVQGVWDDRYAGSGYAEQTRRDFEEMVKRGNPVRYQFEQIAFIGLITNLQISYRRQDLQGYSFTISPHFRHEGETVRISANLRRKVVYDPKQSVAKARAAMDALAESRRLAQLKNASLVQSKLKDSIFNDIGDAIDEVETAIKSAENTVNDQILKPGQDAANALNRAAQAMNSAKTAISATLSTTRQIAASTHMATSSLVDNLKFETWHRSVSGSARAMVATVEQARQDLAFRARPKPKRLHRVRQGESLYAISNLYYGTPHQWRELAKVNRLNSIVLQGGELLEIPEIKL